MFYTSNVVELEDCFWSSTTKKLLLTWNRQHFHESCFHPITGSKTSSVTFPVLYLPFDAVAVRCWKFTLCADLMRWILLRDWYDEPRSKNLIFFKHLDRQTCTLLAKYIKMNPSQTLCRNSWVSSSPWNKLGEKKLHSPWCRSSCPEAMKGGME